MGFLRHIEQLKRDIEAKRESEREAAERSRAHMVSKAKVRVPELAGQISAWWHGLPAAQRQARYRLVELRTVFQAGDHVLGNALRLAGWRRGRANGPLGTPGARYWTPPETTG